MERRAEAVLIVSLIFSTLLAGCCGMSRWNSLPKENLQVADFVDAVQKAIAPVWDGGVAGVPLDNVTIVLQTVHDNKISAEVDYLVVAVKGYYENATTHQISLKLTKHPPALGGEAAAVAPTQRITEQLKDIIQQAQKQIQSSYGTGKHVLYTNEVDLQIQFQVTYDGSIGVNKWAILPVSLTASDEFSAKTTNTITVAFSPPSKPGQ